MTSDIGKGWPGGLLAIILAVATPASAAVRDCKPSLSSVTVVEKTEVEAKRKALQDWLTKAQQIGAGFTRWELAYNRQITCVKNAGGGFQCQAVGMPCTIQQAPQRGRVPIERVPKGRDV